MTDGSLDIAFTNVVTNAKVSAIQVVAGTIPTSTATPTRTPTRTPSPTATP